MYFDVVFTIFFQPHSGKLYSGSHDGTLRIWDTSKLRDDEEDIYNNVKENGVKK